MDDRHGALESSGFSRLPWFVCGAGLLFVVLGVLLVPPDATLKATTKLVFFHGAVVWTALINAAVATVLGGAIVAGETFRRRRSARGDAPNGAAGTVWRSFSFATLFWVLTLVLSFPVMRASWGGILWGETRLVMSFQVVSLYLLAWGVMFLFLLHRDRRWVAAVACGTGMITSYLVVTTPGTFHPDNPIFRSGDPRFIGSFLVILAGLLCLTGGAMLVRRMPDSGVVVRAEVDPGI